MKYLGISSAPRRRFGLRDVKDKILEQLTANTDATLSQCCCAQASCMPVSYSKGLLDSVDESVA